ncbi:SPOR domain-containing protein [Waterburya agarophytonicola K14]|uniref:SPOR domain-containing protein n=1 Tax=Waterburya agarophytonicola KI4 TaxID=2874699 RepID=A0A964FGQ0_9CYAN|nr:SPOR domain-containing protein [Waterburya agarophytonicola]MCC0178316.1 SPOR domain-containing protein [Waterburya agarophytonicola KI4]
MTFTYYKYSLLLLGSVFLTGNLSISVNALENNNFSTATSSVPYLAQEIKSNNKTDSREYTYKAPDSKIISNTKQLIEAQGYRVEVFGSEQVLLQQVKDIEPSAFIKGDTIQVGIFSQQANAENMVRKLAVKGFWARIKVQ